jgi:hypothetical protein
LVSDDPEWEPFGLTPDERSRRRVLHRDITDAMRPSLLEWVRDVVPTDVYGRQVPRVFVRLVDATLDVRLGGREGTSTTPETFVSRLATHSDIEILRVIDYLVGLELVGDTARDSLTFVLTTSRSAWTVGDRLGGVGLVERVPAGVQDAAEEVAERAGKAGDLLREAWAYVHQLEPSPSDAFSRAVRAVEVAAIPKVVPDQAGATLGHVIGQMASVGDWRPPTREDDRSPTAEVVLGMLRTLWRGHRDRHGSRDYSHVTLDEARTAVDLAVPLVDWFDADLVKRREPVTDG